MYIVLLDLFEEAYEPLTMVNTIFSAWPRTDVIEVNNNCPHIPRLTFWLCVFVPRPLGDILLSGRLFFCYTVYDATL